MPRQITSQNTVIICTGGFDPVRSNHVHYLREAKAIANALIVGVNSDAWLVRKKGKNFMTLVDRVADIEALGLADQVLTFSDLDNSANDFIQQVINLYPNDNIIYATGIDKSNTLLEFDFCVSSNVAIITDIGGTQVASSSKLLAQWNSELTQIQSSNGGISLIL